MTLCEVQKTDFSGLYLVKKNPYFDTRGFFERSFCATELVDVWKDKPIRQINRSLTKNKGVVRGMHFQIGKAAEKKLISCLKGEIFDVAVDLRKRSPTFLKHFSFVLNEKSPYSILIGEGFAHGFQTLRENSELLYLHSADYNSDLEGGMNAIDPTLNIKWPLKISERSERDASFLYISNSFGGL